MNSSVGISGSRWKEDSTATTVGTQRWNRPSHRPFRTDGRGVSDVIGTILLLALTVTLFASVFFFVNTFPRPPPQPSSQFSTSLGYKQPALNQITFIFITHLAGPTLQAGNTQIFVLSAARPGVIPNPLTLQVGLGGGTSWVVGQVWALNLTSFGLKTPDNLTVSVISQGILLYHQTVPGSAPNIPPEFVNVGTSPTGPGVGESFTVFAQIVDDDLNPNSVFVNLSQLPGETGAAKFKMTFIAASGTWQYTVPAGVTNDSGTFFMFVNATDNIKQPNSVVIPIAIGSSANGGGSGASVSVLLTVNRSAPVNGSAVTLLAAITDNSGTGGSVTAAFSAAGVTLGTQSGTVAAGSTTTVTQGWTPSSSGSILLSVVASVSGVGSAVADINVTVFPKILLISHNVPSGYGLANESAYLANELTAAGFPFKTMFVPCTSALPSSATLKAFNVVIVDFGSNLNASCPGSATTTDESAITGATGVNFWVVGTIGFGATACASYAAGFLSLFGVTGTSGTCVTQVTTPVAGTYSASVPNGLLGNGVPGSFTINGTLGPTSTFTKVDYFSQGVAHAYLSTGTHPVGAWQTASGSREAALGVDPALLTTALPNGNVWGTGESGTDVVYNVVNWLCRLSTSAGPGRATLDYAVSEVQIVGTTHTTTTTVYAALRANGEQGGVVTATLYVNGAAAIYQGFIVTGTAVVGANGNSVFVALVWEAPAAGSFTLSVVITSSNGDLYPFNNQLPLSILNQATKFA